MGKTTMAEKGSNSGPISRLSNKRSMTAIFTITLNGKFLPMQIIIWGKANQCLPKFEVLNGFCRFANPKHYNNAAETIRLIKEINIPYIEKERISLKLTKIQPALVIMDVFWGQTTEDILTVIKGNNILIVRVPANMTPLIWQWIKHSKPFCAKSFPSGTADRSHTL